ncbi:MAG: hypothetical protein OSB73_17820, partial [Candidatus Latescibacteria bacterium]|nr:hypothetical protein [Candidatus Latescibacterota bacterium]
RPAPAAISVDLELATERHESVKFTSQGCRKFKRVHEPIDAEELRIAISDRGYGFDVEEVTERDCGNGGLPAKGTGAGAYS